MKLHPVHALTATLAAVALAVALVAAADPAAPAAGVASQDLAGPPLGVFDLYADNRTRGLPNHITADLLLLGYSLLRRSGLEDLEDRTLRPAFGDLVLTLAGRLGDAEDPVTQANRRYLALLSALLAADQDGLDPVAAAEYGLVTQAAGSAPSPLWGRPIDYSQFVPRGRYAADPDLGQYFRAMRYAGGVPFLVQSSAATGTSPADAERQAAQAVQLARLIAADPELAARRDRIEALLAWHFGPAEDLTNADLLAVADRAQPPADLPGRLVERARAERHQPRIVDGLVDQGRLESGQTPSGVMTGWRLFPARYSAESAAFQRLVYAGTGRFQGTPASHPFGLGSVGGQPVKAYPSTRELLALLGSPGATQDIETAGETDFAGYPQAGREAAALLGESSGAGAAHVALMRAALGEQDSPQRRTALLAFWTWQRYLEVLYAKQSYTLVGKGLSLELPRPGASLEPATGLYRALQDLAALQSLHAEDPRWGVFADLLGSLIQIGVAQDGGAALGPNAQRLLNRLDLDLLALTRGRDQPIVVDVHTHNEESMVVEEAVGWAQPVWQGEARGARLTHYEFKQPLAQRLTDAAWRERLARGGGRP